MQSSLAKVEAAMLDACVASADSDNPCITASKYHLAAPGGRLRARICLDAASQLNLDSADSCCLASICELLHNASLLHDDLVDRAPSRRGQATVWSLFGDGVAICTGDLMLAAAYSSVGRLSRPSLIPQICSLVHRRTQQVIFGQAAELEAAGRRDTTPDQYESLAIGKSASLLSLCLELPLSLAGHSLLLPKAQQVTSSFAVAYQIADDLEDVDQDKLANSLNFVDVLSAHTRISLSDARSLASTRAEELLVSAIGMAGDLPENCAAVLIAHAEGLLQRLQARTTATLISVNR